MPHPDSMIRLDNSIDHISINGNLIALSAQIQLSGHINITRLSADIQSQGLSPTLQIGIDEAGRGPLFGSVNVAAAILPSAWSGLIEDQPLQGTRLSLLTDSKKLSEKKRDMLYPIIQDQAIGYIIADIPASVIDQLNILQATMQGMRICSEVIIETLARIVIDDQIKVNLLYDGNRCPIISEGFFMQFGLNTAMIEGQAWIKGDARHTSIAAASVLAKVSRDQAMYDFDTKYPHYGFARHKGYPTSAHVQAINEFGALPEHRRSFAPVKKALGVI